MELALDKIGSITRNIPLSHRAILHDDLAAQAGAVLAVEVLADKCVYNKLELPTGRMATVMRGDRLAVCLGERRALKGFVGTLPGRIAVGDEIHLLNMGGVAGLCTGGNYLEVGMPLPVRVLGGILHDGRPAHIGAYRKVGWADRLAVRAPVVLVSGTCMNAGKTVAACELIKQFSRHGLRVAAGKLTGVSLIRDTSNMRDHGATAALDFTDAGLASTTDPATVLPAAKGILGALDAVRPEVIVIELGDGLLGGYGVREILEDPEIQAATAVHVLCAHDPVGALGAQTVAAEMGLQVDIVTGPTTDNQVGTDFIRRDLGLGAANAKTDGAALCELAWGMLRSRVAPEDRPVCETVAGVAAAAVADVA